MEQTFQQLGQLLLGAVPTAVLLLLLFTSYRVLVAGPLGRALDERYARTEGAVTKAKSDIAAADARTQEYEAHLREARVAIFKALEARRQQALAARTAVSTQARQAAEARVRDAKALIEKEMLEARSGLQGQAERLAQDVIQAILRGASASTSAAGGQP